MPNGSDRSPACTTFLEDQEAGRQDLGLRGLQLTPQGSLPCVQAGLVLCGPGGWLVSTHVLQVGALRGFVSVYVMI